MCLANKYDIHERSLLLNCEVFLSSMLAARTLRWCSDWRQTFVWTKSSSCYSIGYFSPSLWKWIRLENMFLDSCVFACVSFIAVRILPFLLCHPVYDAWKLTFLRPEKVVDCFIRKWFQKSTRIVGSFSERGGFKYWLRRFTKWEDFRTRVNKMYW